MGTRKPILQALNLALRRVVACQRSGLAIGKGVTGAGLDGTQACGGRPRGGEDGKSRGWLPLGLLSCLLPRTPMQS